MTEYFSFAIHNNKLVSLTGYPVPKKQKGLFTTIKVKNFNPLFLEFHLKRLSLKNREEVLGNIQKLLKANKKHDAAVRISVFGKTIVYHARVLPKNGEVKSAMTMKVLKRLPTTKIINRNIYDAAKKQAEKMHTQDVIFISKNNLLESTIANVISQNIKGQLITPFLQTQGVKGIIRNLLIKKNLIKEENIPLGFDQPIVCINSLRVIGIEKLNGHTLPNPKKLLKIVRSSITKEEEEYENRYYR